MLVIQNLRKVSFFQKMNTWKMLNVTDRLSLPVWVQKLLKHFFTAVMVSWMSKFNPFIMIAASLLLVTMDRGASEVASALSLNHSFADILTGIILFFIIATEFFITYKVTLRKNSKKEA